MMEFWGYCGQQQSRQDHDQNMFSDVGPGDDNAAVPFQRVWLCSGGCFFYGSDLSLDFLLAYISVLLKSYS